MRHKLFGTTALIAALAAGAFAIAPAHAASSLSAAYTTMTNANPDVGGAVTGVVTGLVQSTLGPSGLPVSTGKEAFADVNGAGELLWWTPQAGLVLPGTTFNWGTTITLPFSQANFFPDGPSGSDGGSTGFTSAIFSGNFVTPAGGSVTFNLGSDDDAWVFLNGLLVIDNGGIHAPAVAPTTVSSLVPGVNTIEIFYADRHVTQAEFDFSADVTLNPGVPESSTWAMMVAGFGGLSLVAFRRARKSSVAIG